MARILRSKNKFIAIAWLLSISAAILLFVGAAISWRQFNTSSTAQSSDSQSGPSTDKPSEQDFNNHKVPADQPRFISIPAISAWAIIKPVGVNSKNQIEAPGNIYEAGWYTGSAKPGQDGAMFISGHVSSWEAHGVFYDLKLLEPNDQITIERGNGAKFTYKVIKSETYNADNVDMETALAPVNPDRAGLNLITCAGEVIEGTNEFDKRIVVFAEQID